jgi:hypothetical protein
MSDSFTKTILLGGFDRATSNDDRMILSLLRYAEAHHADGADSLVNPVLEALHRLRPYMDGIAYHQLSTKLNTAIGRAG